MMRHTIGRHNKESLESFERRNQYEKKLKEAIRKAYVEVPGVSIPEHLRDPEEASLRVMSELETLLADGLQTQENPQKDTGLVTISGAEYMRLREIDRGPYTFTWQVNGLTLCETRRTIEEARAAAVEGIMRWQPYPLGHVGFVVRPRTYPYWLEGSDRLVERLEEGQKSTFVVASLNDEGEVFIQGP